MHEPSQKRLVFIFVDGIGIGSAGKHNPFYNPSLRILSLLAGVRCEYYDETFIFKPIDASLGLEGLPQSSTGQTALFTGVNPIPRVKRHISGFPTTELREILHANSIFRQLENRGVSTLFANAYHKRYFDRKLSMLSATTHAVMAKNNQNFQYLDNLKAEDAIFADITNEYLIEEGWDIKQFSPQKAANILLKLARKYSFVLYEIPFMDGLGHKQQLEKIQEAVEILEQFFTTLKLNRTPDISIVFTSDHGNIEDFSTRTHTTNPVPLMVWSQNPMKIADQIEGIEDVTPAIVDFLAG